MGKTVTFPESVLSVRFPVTIRLVDSLFDSFVESDGLLLHLAGNRKLWNKCQHACSLLLSNVLGKLPRLSVNIKQIYKAHTCLFFVNILNT